MRRNPKEESRQIGGALGAVKIARPAVGGGKLGDCFKELPITTKCLPLVCLWRQGDGTHTTPIP